MASTGYGRSRGYVLTPNTAQQIIDTYAYPVPHMEDDMVPSSSSQSPDSLYTDDSPRFPEDVDAFEYDHDDHEEHEASAYETLVSEGPDASSQASPAWGRWPQDSTFGGPGWTPLPSHGARHGSIISISPRGSIGAARRGSAPISKLSTSSSNPSFLSVDQESMLQARRRSSAKSSGPSRRRSSVFSNGSMIDPLEDQRLRNFASMSQLARRFSELVEVMAPLEGEDYGRNDVNVARALMSAWSPYSTETDVSEIHTAPYIPTPGLAPIPSLMSNYPLSSVAREPVYSLNTPEESRHQFRSPGFGLSLDTPAMPYTPPAPVEPAQQLRTIQRPDLSRTATGYIFPSIRPTQETIAQDVPRPCLRRSTSTPAMSPAEPTPNISITKQNRPTGSFPLARSQPLGLSRLRESSAPPAPPEPRRPSLVAERRMSIVTHGSRRPSTSRKVSLTLAPPSIPGLRRPSADSGRGSLSRKLSAGVDLRKVSLDPSRKLSSASRKSSVVSLGEYGYLATQITPKAAPAEEHTLAVSRLNGESLRARRNAPPAIVLPPYQFPARVLGSPGQSSGTSRYSALDSFFGRNTPALSSSSSIDPLSPSSDGLKSPLSPGLVRSVLDRGRPLSSPQFSDGIASQKHHSSSGFRASGEHVSPETVLSGPKGVHRSPSYRFPLQPDGVGLLPSALEIGPPEQKIARVTFEQVPLKSILVRKTTESLVSPADRPQPQRATSHPHISDVQLATDIQAHLQAKRGSRLESAHKVDVSQSKPPMARQSSFTRLFQRAKAQATSLVL